MPEPREGESKKSYINRCIPYYIRKGKTPKQAAGQCHGMWESHKKGKKV